MNDKIGTRAPQRAALRRDVNFRGGTIGDGHPMLQSFGAALGPFGDGHPLVFETIGSTE